MFQSEPLVTNTFKGRRFNDHGLDLDVLPELVTYNRIIVETAKELWRKNNPEKQRLKKNLEDDFRLKIFNLEKGSVAVPICREIPSGHLLVIADELDDAVDLVNEAIECVDSGKRIPAALPKNVIPLFANYGRTLQNDEYIEQKSARTGRIARFTQNVREEFERRTLSEYEDEFDIIGSVVMARVNKPKFAVLVHGLEVEAPFEDDFTDIIFQALESKTGLQVRMTGLADFSADGTMDKIKRLDVVELLDSTKPIEIKEVAVPFWKRCQQLIEAAPPEAFQNIPKDSVEKLDNYLYGAQS
jgi:hypothetical protein